mgnify:CR=1 FL=1
MLTLPLRKENVMRKKSSPIIEILLLFLLCFCCPREASAQTTDSWSVPVRIQIGTSNFRLHLGVRPNATDGFNVGIDTLAPPPAFTPYAVFSISAFPNTLRADFRGPGSPITWNLRVINSADQPIQISWDVGQVPLSSTFILNDTLDMLTENSATFTGDRTVSLKYTAISTGLADPGVTGKMPQRFSLRSYPNPFITAATLEIEAPAPSSFVVRIFNLLGQEIRTLPHSRVAPGRVLLAWDGRDKMGRMVPAGVYICRVESEGQSVLSKLYHLR